MPSFVTELLPVIVLVGLGAILGARSILTVPTIDGLKRLVSGVTLPVLLFSAFSRMRPEAPHLILAVAIFAACALMGLIGSAIARLFRLPSPATALMFQGFEAGMLGYALFASFYGADRTPAFAAADLGQVLYVFTILMARLGDDTPGGAPDGASAASSASTRSVAENSAAGNGAKNLAARLLSSPVIIAIGLGLIAALFAPEAKGMPWAPDGFLGSTLAAVGGLTTPLVCLVVGFGLKDGLAGAGKAATAVIARMLVAGALGSLIGFVLVPALGFDRTHSFAVLTLFLLPPPFIIPVFRNEPKDAAYVSATLSLHTVASLAAAALIAVVAQSVAGGAA